MRVHIPKRVTPRQVKCLVNGKKNRLTWDKPYALVGSVKLGDNINVNFPIAEQKVETDIESQHYHLITKGNEVVDIYPRGQFCPLYQRDYYRMDQTRWKKNTRFVSDESLFW